MPFDLVAPARLVAAALVACLAFAPWAAAQPADPQAPPGGLTLEQLMGVEVRSVFGASRFLQRVIDAPASVSIVTAEEIDRFGYRTLGDVLGGVRGMFVSYDRNYSYLGVRGFSRPGDYNTRVLLLVDGHRLNDNIYDQALIGTEFPVDVDLVERIEIVRGPSSTLYGTNAFFAIVNVVTRRSDARGVSGAVDVGSLGTRRVRGTLGGRLPRAGSYVLSATAYQSDGQQDLVYPALAFAPGGARADPSLDRDQFGQLFASARLGGWSAQAVFGSREKGIPTGAYGTALDDGRTQTVDERSYVDLQYEGDWHGTTMRLRGAFDWYRYDGDYGYLEDGVRRLERDRSIGRWWSSEVSGVRRAGAHLITAGLELRGNIRQDQRLVVDEPPATLLDVADDSFVTSLYLQDEYTISPRVMLNAGLGYDHYPDFSGQVTVRGAAIFKPRLDHAIKFIYGTAFRAPNSYEQHYYAPPGHGVHLEPERVRTAELSWEQYVAGRVRLAASVFHNRTSNLITQVDEPGHLFDIGFENSGIVRARGAGVEVEGALGRDVHALASYTFVNAGEAFGGVTEQPVNSPRHVATARVTSPLGSRHLFGAAELRYIGERRTLSGSAAAAATVMRATLSTREFLGKLRLSLTVHNLFDATYGHPGGAEHFQDVIVQDGRTALVRVKWRL